MSRRTRAFTADALVYYEDLIEHRDRLVGEMEGCLEISARDAELPPNVIHLSHAIASINERLEDAPRVPWANAKSPEQYLHARRTRAELEELLTERLMEVRIADASHSQLRADHFDTVPMSTNGGRKSVARDGRGVGHSPARAS